LLIKSERVLQELIKSSKEGESLKVKVIMSKRADEKAMIDGIRLELTETLNSKTQSD
jgi:hypothetical protein